MNIGLSVCILTAGKGSRMGNRALSLNKALLPINQKAIISEIIKKFPSNTEFVIGLGFLGDQVKNYLNCAHPDTTFKYISVDNFENKGSGPGYSLLCCKKYLQKPFFFVSCDTLWEEDIEYCTTENWFGVANVSHRETNQYCNLEIYDDKILSIEDKKFVSEKKFKAFTGLCFIFNYKTFWAGLAEPELIDGEHQISKGINNLINHHDVYAREINWTDVGDLEKYENALKNFENFDFSKSDEALYIINGQVIKFFQDYKITSKRVAKAKIEPSLFPQITYHKGQFYAYKYIKGETLYQNNSTFVFEELLRWLNEKVWKIKKVDPEIFELACFKFYNNKTFERLKKYEDKYNSLKEKPFINGEKVCSVKELLNKVDWKYLCKGVPSFIHGDLHFDNIIYNIKRNEFKLIDWRQDFEGHIEFGDIYYDFAKLYGGIILNYDYVKQNLVTYTETGENITFDFAQRHSSNKHALVLERFFKKNGYDLSKVKILVAIIYLNMSPLHHKPFDKMLHALGRVMLQKALVPEQDREI